MYVIEKEMKMVYDHLMPNSVICLPDLENEHCYKMHKITCDVAGLTSSLNRFSLNLGAIRMPSSFPYGRVIYEYQNIQFSNFGKYECITNEDDFIHLLLHDIVQNKDDYSVFSFEFLWNYIVSDLDDPSRMQKLKYIKEYLHYFEIEKENIESLVLSQKEASYNQKVIDFSLNIHQNMEEEDIKKLIKQIKNNEKSSFHKF